MSSLSFGQYICVNGQGHWWARSKAAMARKRTKGVFVALKTKGVFVVLNSILLVSTVQPVNGQLFYDDLECHVAFQVSPNTSVSTGTGDTHWTVCASFSNCVFVKDRWFHPLSPFTSMSLFYCKIGQKLLNFHTAESFKVECLMFRFASFLPDEAC